MGSVEPIRERERGCMGSSTASRPSTAGSKSRARSAGARGSSRRCRSPRYGNPYRRKLASRIPQRVAVDEATDMNKELAYRESNGLAVTLWWHSSSNRLRVSVHDGNTGDWFALNAEADNALDVFEHPFAYAA